MANISQLSEEERNDIVQRLKRIEGQARGVQKMVDEDRECGDILTQLASIRAAVNSLNGELLEAYLLRCIQNPDDFGSPEKAVQQAVRALVRS
ncbi:MAG: metal-sensitive transcriptional regulator [Thermomicrobiales bacterium]|nr:metal-sensitive transcriptional regulator [Thermomicrobiales bacterium]MCO5220796.1 metal-sensitive transcriptional regulator [Thermomicrobiales bacterium]